MSKQIGKWFTIEEFDGTYFETVYESDNFREIVNHYNSLNDPTLYLDVLIGESDTDIEDDYLSDNPKNLFQLKPYFKNLTKLLND